MKFILNESTKFILEEKFVLTEKIDKTKYPNIVKFYPDSAQINNFWASLGLKNVDKFNADMLKRLDSYFGADWITKEHCDELIKTASSLNKGMNYTGVNALFAKFEKEQKEANKEVGKETKPEETDKDKKSAEEQEQARKNSQQFNWQQLYDSCKTEADFKAFWDGNALSNIEVLQKGYFKAEWNTKANLVKSYGTPFIEQVEKFGFDSISNPFISFLKNYIDKLNITKEKYVGLHNAVANNLVSVDVLKDIKNSIYKEADLLINPNLYVQSNENIYKYLGIQQRLAKEHHNLPEKYKNTFSTKSATILSNLMLANGNLKDLTAYIQPGGPLRNLTELNQVIIQLLGESKKNITDSEILKIVNNIHSETEAKKILSYLVDYLRFSFKGILDKVNKQLNDKLYQNRDQVRPLFSETISFDKKLDFEFNGQQIEKLLIELGKKANMTA